MEEIDIKDLLIYFKSKLLYIIFITLFIMSIGIVYKALIEKPKYPSSTSLILTGFTTNNENETTINNNDLSINQQLITTYQEITKSRKVLTNVIEELKLEYEVEELAKNVNVTGINDTEIIKITVIDTNPKHSYKIVKEISRIFCEEVKEIYNVSNISILDEPEITTDSVNMGLIKSIMLFFIAGIILSLSIIFIIYYFDNTIKTTEQIERNLDVPILGSIPDYNKKMKRGKK